MKNITIRKYQEIKTMPYNSKLILNEKVIDYEKKIINVYELWQSNRDPKIKYTIEWEEELCKSYQELKS